MTEHEILAKDKQRSKITSGIIHLGIIILLILPFLKYPVPPPGQEGVMVSFGDPDIGMGDDRPITQDHDPDISPTPPAVEETAVEETVDETVEETKPDPKPVKKPKAEPKPPKKVMTSAEKAAIAVKKQKAAKKRKDAEIARKKAAAEAKKKAAAEAKRKAKAAAAAKKKADYEAAKSKIGSPFGDGKGKGQGNTNTPGSQGKSNGDPNANKVGFGGGKVGGGLGNRGVKGAQKVKNTTNFYGRVTIKVCVNSSGKVISANFTQKGSSTSKAALVAIAKRNAKTFRFTKGGASKQCGTISYNFKPQ